MIELNKHYIVARKHCIYDKEDNNNEIIISLFLKKLARYEPELLKIILAITDTYFNTKEQIVYIDEVYTCEDGTILYNYYYGIMGFHEGCTSENNVRELTEEEKNYKENNEFWKLPQQFYQSIPNF